MSWSGGFADFGNMSAEPVRYRRSQDITNNSVSGLNDAHAADKIAISQIIPGILNEKIVAVVIAKESPRHFPSKKDPSTEHYLLSFTVRDSPSDFINATCWGSEPHITGLAELFHIGDVVELFHCSVQNKPSDGSDERFRPWTTSPYCLSLSENRGSLKVVNDWYLEQMSYLQHMPTKPENDFYTIADVHESGQNLQGEYINILVVVKKIGAAKEITTKLGKKMTRCEIKLFDETSNNLEMTLWDKELIHMAESWTPRDYVIFAADVRATYNEFKKTMVVTTSSKTVFTVNPDTQEAHKLYQFAQTAIIEDNEPMEASFQDGGTVHLSMVHDVYTVSQIKQLMSCTDDIPPVYGIAYTTITTMDIDNDTRSIVAFRCTKCLFRVDAQTRLCSNLNCMESCQTVLGEQTPNVETIYDLRLALSDYTGTISGCKVVNDVSRNMIGSPPEEFDNLTESQRTNIKWHYLLERCKIYFKVTSTTFDRPRWNIRILSCERADLQEAINNIKI